MKRYTLSHLFIILSIILAIQSNLVLAEQNLYLGTRVESPDAFLGKVYTPKITLQSNKNVSNVIISLYVDEKLIGSKHLNEINENENRELFFDVGIPATSYIGEHYLRSQINFRVDEKDNEITYFDSFFVRAQQPNSYLRAIGFILVIINGIFLLNEIVYYRKQKCLGSSLNLDETTRKYAAQSILSAFPLVFAILTFSLGQTEKIIPTVMWSIPLLMFFFLTTIICCIFVIYFEKKYDTVASRCVIYSTVNLCSTILWMLSLLWFV